MKLSYYLRVWYRMASMVLQDQVLTTWSFIAFLAGKLLRFFLFYIFLVSVFGNNIKLLHYSREEIIIFFLVFNVVDISGQFLFRGVYTFKNKVISGDYDHDLLKPLPAFFLPIFGWSDIVDLFTLIPLWILFSIYYFTQIDSSSILFFLYFLVLLLSSMVVVFSFHLLIASLSIITFSGDNLLWVYRETLDMARFPTDIYGGFLRYFITYAVPIVLVATIPSKALLGYIGITSILLSLILAVTFLMLSMIFWKFSLKRYSSASS